MKKVIYIAGPITGVPRYWEAFETAEDELTAAGYLPLSPARMPDGMENEKAMRICLAMIDAADAVLFLPWQLPEPRLLRWSTATASIPASRGLAASKN